MLFNVRTVHSWQVLWHNFLLIEPTLPSITCLQGNAVNVHLTGGKIVHRRCSETKIVHLNLINSVWVGLSKMPIVLCLFFGNSFCMCEEVVEEEEEEEEGVLWRHIQSFLACSIKNKKKTKATKGLGTRCVLVERKEEGEWAGGSIVDEGGVFYHWAPFMLGSKASELLRKVCASVCESGSICACRFKNRNSIIPSHWRQLSGILTQKPTNRINYETQSHRCAACSVRVCLFFFLLVFKRSSHQNTTSELMKQAAFLFDSNDTAHPKNENSVIIYCWSATVLKYSLKQPQ